MNKPEWEYPYDLFIKFIAQEIRLINDQKLKKYNLSSPQAQLLEIIERKLRKGIKINRKDLEKVMNLKGPSITSLLNGLEKKGCIIRNTGSTDARTFQLNITEKGENLLREMEMVFEDTEKRMLTGMSEEEKKNFLDLLVRTYRNLNNDINKK